MKKTSEITGKTTIGEAIQEHPETASVFADYGLHCVGCPMAEGENSETIEEAVKVHHIDLKEFLKDLNKAAK